MKALFILLLTFNFSLGSYAQHAIELSTDKTVSLSFPAQVSYVDLGSSQIDARLVGPGSKVVLVKALEKDFVPTNLTVVTSGDEVFSFTIGYHPNPVKDRIDIPAKVVTAASYAAGIMDNGRSAMGMVHNRDGLYAQVRGIYVLDSILFFHLKVANNTSLVYDIAAIRFLVKNKKSGKRVASQEQVIPVQSMEGAYRRVPHMGNAVMVAVLPKIALSHSQLLQIEVVEQYGSRNLQLKVPPHKLAKAIQLTAY